MKDLGMYLEYNGKGEMEAGIRVTLELATPIKPWQGCALTKVSYFPGASERSF